MPLAEAPRAVLAAGGQHRERTQAREREGTHGAPIRPFQSHTANFISDADFLGDDFAQIYSRAAKNAKPAQPPRQTYSPPTAPPSDPDSSELVVNISAPPSPSTSVPTLHEDSASDAPSSPTMSPLGVSFPEHGRYHAPRPSPTPAPLSPPPQSPRLPVPPPSPLALHSLAKSAPSTLTFEGWHHPTQSSLDILLHSTRSWYTGYNPAVADSDSTGLGGVSLLYPYSYGSDSDWCLEPWRPITFQESGVRFTPL